MSPTAKLFIIDHDEKVTEEIKACLIANGYEVTTTIHTLIFKKDEQQTHANEGVEKEFAILESTSKVDELILLKLHKFGFDSKTIGFNYLAEAVSIIMKPYSDHQLSLRSIFQEITPVPYTSIFNSIRRLIVITYERDPKKFKNLYYGIPRNELEAKYFDERPIPSVKELIYHIASQVRLEVEQLEEDDQSII